jgi:hypothetical protein
MTLYMATSTQAKRRTAVCALSCPGHPPTRTLKRGRQRRCSFGGLRRIFVGQPPGIAARWHPVVAALCRARMNLSRSQSPEHSVGNATAGASPACPCHRPGGSCHRYRPGSCNLSPNQPAGSPSQHGNHPIRATRKRAPVGGVHVRSGVGFMWEPRKSYPGRPSPGVDRPDPLSTTPQSRLLVIHLLLLGASCLLPRR